MFLYYKYMFCIKYVYVRRTLYTFLMESTIQVHGLVVPLTQIWKKRDLKCGWSEHTSAVIYLATNSIDGACVKQPHTDRKTNFNKTTIIWVKDGILISSFIFYRNTPIFHKKTLCVFIINNIFITLTFSLIIHHKMN